MSALLKQRYLPPEVATDLFLYPDRLRLAEIRRDYPERRAELWTLPDWGDARSVTLADFGHERTELPPGLSTSPRLARLDVPRHLVDQLRERHVRNLAGELRVHGEGAADLTGIDAAPGVTHLGGYKVVPKLDGRAFPSLCGLVTWDKTTKRRRETFASLPHLRALFVPASAGLLADVPRGLGFLQLLWGGLASIEGLAVLQRLEWLMIDRVTKLSSLAGLEKHPTLQRIELTHCAALEDVSALLTCPALHTVNMSYCKALRADMRPLAKMLTARGGALKIEP